jgi:site-specific DNA-methyltransferase (adenine-specific)
MNWKNKLYFGDNLEVLRESIPSASVDLVYLDPPFNSKANYNILFKTPKGLDSSAQITAFEDTWHWGEQSEKEFAEIIHHSNTDVSEMIQSLRKFLGENDLMAYLTIMTNRLLELHRVLKPTGSIYLHCDPTASHYLKILCDVIFCSTSGVFRNEIVWHYKRWPAKQSNFQRMHDIILFYSKSRQNTFNTFHEGLSAGTLKRWKGKKSKVEFEGNVRLVTQMTDEDSLGTPADDVWNIPVINSQAKERLGYPTQKPQTLLERIVKVSSNENDVVLDPFCGCGTAVHAAEKLRRRWIGIDITHLAIGLIEKRLKDAFPDIQFDVEGTPKDLDSAQNLADRDKYQFQWWACSLVNAQPFQGKKKGADGGIDGLIYFQDDRTTPKKIVVSVKGGNNVNVAMVRDLAHVVDREKASIGIFITMADPTRPMKEEAIKAGYYASPIGANFPKVQILTIKGLLDGTERAKYPDLMQGGLTFKKATIDSKTTQEGLF